MTLQIPSVVQTEIRALDHQQVVVSNFISVRILAGPEYRMNVPIVLRYLTSEIGDLSGRTDRQSFCFRQSFLRFSRAVSSEYQAPGKWQENGIQN